MALPQTPLQPYQIEMLRNVDTMMDRFKDSRLSMFSLGGRRQGKSMAMKMPVTTSTIAGNEITSIIFDEMADAYTNAAITIDSLTKAFSRGEPVLGALGPEVVLDDPKWPGSRVEIWRKETDKRDPRHPNPKAGRITRYEIKGDIAMAETVDGYEFARQRAQHLHDDLVLEIKRQRQKENPLFGRF
jgi:hypothetical protein